MTTLYVTEPHSLIKKDGETLLVQTNGPVGGEERRPARKLRIPLIKVDEVVIVGDSTLTAPALAALMENRAAVTFLGPYGEFRGRVSPAEGRNSLLRLAQFRVHENPAAGWALAQSFVAGKLQNQRALLMRANRKLVDEEIKKAVNSLHDLIGQVQGLVSDGTPPPDPGRPQAGSMWGSLQGLEGAASAQYFRVFGRLLRGDPGMTFEGRSRRPPRDPVNALLSYGYTLLLHGCSAALQSVGLDPYIGFLHSAQYSKPALALDLMEEFRAPVVDSVALTLINNRTLTREDFHEELGSFRLKDEPRRTFLRKYEERLNTEIEHPIFKYKASYRRCLHLQARLLAKTLSGELDRYPAFRIR